MKKQIISCAAVLAMLGTAVCVPESSISCLTTLSLHTAAEETDTPDDAATESQVYDTSTLTLGTKLSQGDTLHYDKQNVGSVANIVNAKGDYDLAFISEEDYVLPFDAEVVGITALTIYLAPAVDGIAYTDVRTLSDGDTIDRNTNLLCYDYVINNRVLPVFLPSYYDKYIGTGTIRVKSIDHENKRIQLESVDRPEMVKGDVNGDGIADVSDIVLFQKWLLGDPDAVLSNWKAADLYADGQMDAMDLLLMKQTLVRQEQMDTTPALLIQNYEINLSELGWIGENTDHLITLDGFRYSLAAETDAIDAPAGDYTESLRSNGIQDLFVYDESVLQEIADFAKSAEKYKDCAMKSWNFNIEDYGTDTLYVLYTDSSGVMQKLALCQIGGECAWLDNEEVQAFVTMLIEKGYFSDKSNLDTYLYYKTA